MKKTVITLLFALIALTSQAEQQPQVLHYDQPADYFEEALVIGNGTMGGIVYGGTTCDRPTALQGDAHHERQAAHGNAEVGRKRHTLTARRKIFH